MQPIVIVKVGSTLPALRARKGDFEDWIVSGMGLTMERVAIADALNGDPLPTHSQVSGIVIDCERLIRSIMSSFRICGARWMMAALCLLLAGCASDLGQSSSKSNQPEKIDILALGDSYTIGESVSESERWPVQLAATLREQGVPVAEPTIIARTGWTTDELEAAIQRENPQGTYELVSLLIGVNNQYRGLDVNEYRVQFRDLLQQAIDFAGGEAGRVIVLSIPDWGVTPFAASRDGAKIAGEIDRFNWVNRQETESLGARYVDVTAVSRRAATDGTLVAEDGLHPSGKMYEAWVELVLPEALTALGRGDP
jgi:lysophospholipase L1-like esterase